MRACNFLCVLFFLSGTYIVTSMPLTHYTLYDKKLLYKSLYWFLITFVRNAAEPQKVVTFLKNLMDNKIPNMKTTNFQP